MAEEIRSWRRWPARHWAAAAIMTALPLLAVGGALLPNLVEVEALRASDTVTPQASNDPYLAHEEVLIPRNFWTEVVPELNEIASLFVDVAAVSQTMAKVRSITGVVATERDLILFPNNSPRAHFLQTTVVSATPPVGAPGQITPILEDRCQEDIFCFKGEAVLDAMAQVASNTFAGAGGGTRAVAATAIPVPEPSTATLITFGLLLVAGARRRS